MEITDLLVLFSISICSILPIPILPQSSSLLYPSFSRIQLYCNYLILCYMSQKLHVYLIFLYINLVLVTAVFFHCLPSFHSNFLPTNIFVTIRTVCYLATYTIQFHMYIVFLIEVLYHCTVWSNVAIAIRAGGHIVWWYCLAYSFSFLFDCWYLDCVLWAKEMW